MNIFKAKSIDEFIANRKDEKVEIIASVIISAMIFGLGYLALFL